MVKYGFCAKRLTKTLSQHLADLWCLNKDVQCTYSAIYSEFAQAVFWSLSVFYKWAAARQMRVELVGHNA